MPVQCRRAIAITIRSKTGWGNRDEKGERDGR